jgi:PAS domain S-box-containing protein
MLPVGVCVCDHAGAIVRYNRSAIELWGCTPNLGEQADVFLTRATGLCDATTPPANWVGSVLASGTPIRDLELSMVRQAGSRAVVRVNIDSLMDDAGVSGGAVICLRDITDSWRLRAALRRTERQSLALLETLPVAVYITDTDGRITAYNQAAVELWGREPELGTDTWCGSAILRWPDGRLMQNDECPMAVALRERRAIRGAEAVAERPDGERVHFLAYPSPIWDEEGALVGAINTLVDITGRKSNEELTHYVASIVDSSNDAIVGKDLNGIITSWNRGAERLFGYSPAETIGQPITMLMPLERQDEETEILRRIRHGERIDHYETVRRRKDGSLVEISLAVSPVKNAQGAIVGASKIARDITEQKRATEKQMLLLREMNHRVKNLFAVASGVVTLSARFAQTPDEMAKAVRARLNALSQAHDLTLPDMSDGIARSESRTTLHAMVATIVSPYSDPPDEGNSRITIHGPDVWIGGGATTSLALLLHEFATNAAKYGSLAVPTGQVDVGWSVSDDNLHLVWCERGGPPVDQNAVQAEGFGSLLARATVKSQLGGSISHDWQCAGLTVHLKASLARLAK